MPLGTSGPGQRPGSLTNLINYAKEDKVTQPWKYLREYHADQRKVINGKRLTVKQSLQFDYFMENSETFRNRFFELSTQDAE
jgi:hypothetical protein